MEAFASFVDRKDSAKISSFIASADQPSSIATESTSARTMAVAPIKVWEELRPKLVQVFTPLLSS